MAVGLKSDFVIYDDEFHAGVTEVEAQNLRAFGAASRNAITINSLASMGDYRRSTFFKSVSSLITRRDDTVVTTPTALSLSHDENISVKLKRKVGPVEHTVDAFRAVMAGARTQDAQREMSFILGQQVGQARLKVYLDAALTAADAAIANIAALTTDQSAGPTKLTHTTISKMLRLFGDRASDIVLLAMHSEPWFDLVENAIGTNGFDGIASAIINSGIPATLGRSALVTDATALQSGSGSTQKNHVLGFVPGAIRIDESEPLEMVGELVTGKENLTVRIQGEFAFNLSLLGYKWDITNGGANPDDSTIGTGTNWDKAVTSDKDTAGARLLVDGV